MSQYQAGVMVCLDVEFREFPGGPYIDPSDARFDVLNPSGVVVVADEPTTIVTSPGRHRGCYASQTSDPLGTWTIRFKATIDGEPVSEDCTFELVSDASPPGPTGPCGPWPFDETCCDMPEDVDDAVVERWQRVATDILWAASGRRHGLCERTVRPCLRRCGGGLGEFGPYRDADGWHNSFCGCREDCSCTSLCEVVLPGPVNRVLQVLIDGDELEPENYRLDLVGSEWRLLRTDGGCFPVCSDMTASCEDVGSFCVTYEYGIALSGLAIAAVSELTCELSKACSASCKTCRLPKNVQATVRRGVAINFDTAISWVKSLPMVGSFLDAANPRGLQSSPTISSFDLPATRTTPIP